MFDSFWSGAIHWSCLLLHRKDTTPSWILKVFQQILPYQLYPHLAESRTTHHQSLPLFNQSFLHDLVVGQSPLSCMYTFLKSPAKAIIWWLWNWSQNHRQCPASQAGSVLNCVDYIVVWHVRYATSTLLRLYSLHLCYHFVCLSSPSFCIQTLVWRWIFLLSAISSS